MSFITNDMAEKKLNMGGYYKYFIMEEKEEPPFWGWKRCDYETYKMADKLERTKSRNK